MKVVEWAKAAGVLLLGIAALIAALRIQGPQRLTEGRPSPRVDDAKGDSSFQLIQLGTMRRDQFLLDRNSGRVWHLVCAGKVEGADCKGAIQWEEVARP